MLQWSTHSSLVSLSAGSAEEFGEMAARFEGARVTALELNLSCPNVAEHGVNFASDPAATEAVTRAVKARSPGAPIWVKLSPNVTDIASVRGATRPHVQLGARACSSDYYYN